MKLLNDPPGINIGSLVMNYHHGLLRFGIVKSQRTDNDGWSHFTIHFLEDRIHEASVEWDKKMNSKRVHSNELRADFLKPVSPEWLRNVTYAYRRFSDERRTENG